MELWARKTLRFCKQNAVRSSGRNLKEQKEEKIVDAHTILEDNKDSILGVEWKLFELYSKSLAVFSLSQKVE